MTTIVTRAGKGSPLTNAEVDTNFTNLNADKLEKSQNLADLTNTATARANLGLTIGTHVQAYSADLLAIAGLGSAGFVVRSGAGTALIRTLAFAAGLTITNADGVAGNPQIAPANDLAALEALGGNGIAVRSGVDTWVQRTITNVADRTTVTNGDGVAGNIIVDIAATYQGQASIVTVGTVTAGTWSSAISAADASVTLVNGTRQARFSAAAISPATTRTFTLPDLSDTLVTLTATQTLTNKTFAGPVFTGAALAADGAVATPSRAFASETGLGTYRPGSAQIGFAANGGQRVLFDFTSDKSAVTLTAAVGQDATLTLTRSDSWAFRNSNATNHLDILQNGTITWQVQGGGSGHFVPGVTDSRDIGTTTARVRRGYFKDWLYCYGAYTDGSNHSFLAVTGYSMLLTEVGSVPATDFTLGTAAAKELIFSTTNTARWRITAAGHWRAQTDNTYDFGATGANRARDIYFARQLIGVDGSASVPAVATSSATNTGISFASNVVKLGTAGVIRFVAYSDYVGVNSSMAFGWSSGNIEASTPDLLVYRGGANIMQQRNGTAAQERQLYATYTDASNGEWLTMRFASGTFQIYTNQNGTGTARQLNIGTLGSANIQFVQNGTSHSQIAPQGYIIQRAYTGSLILLVDQTATTASDHAQVMCRVPGATGGDAKTTFAIFGVATWEMGVRNSDSDALVISAASLGTSNKLRIPLSGDADLYTTLNIPTGSFYKVNALQVVSARKTGWALATGAATRTTYDTATVTLPQLAERVKALIDDLHATAGHGLIGT